MQLPLPAPAEGSTAWRGKPPALLADRRISPPGEGDGKNVLELK